MERLRIYNQTKKKIPFIAAPYKYNTKAPKRMWSVKFLRCIDSPLSKALESNGDCRGEYKAECSIVYHAVKGMKE